jgi:hypothetical protein
MSPRAHDLFLHIQHFGADARATRLWGNALMWWPQVGEVIRQWDAKR